MNQPINIKKVTIRKVPPKVVVIRLARPTQVVETAWEQVQW